MQPTFCHSHTGHHEIFTFSGIFFCLFVFLLERIEMLNKNIYSSFLFFVLFLREAQGLVTPHLSAGIFRTIFSLLWLIYHKIPKISPSKYKLPKLVTQNTLR